MAQLTAMQTLFTNLESIDIKVPQGIKDVYLQMEKEQIIKSFNEGTFYSDEKINAEQYYNETYSK